jgi:hypothetical protein
VGRSPYWSSPHAFFTAPQCGFLVQQVPVSVTAVTTLNVVVRGVGPLVPRRLPQLDNARFPMLMTDWVADSGATNHTTPHLGHIFSLRPPSFAHPSSIIVGNGSVMSVTSVGNSMLPRPFYLNDVLVAPDLVQSLLSVRHFTTDNSCSMEFDPLGLSMKDLATSRVLARYDSTDPLYTLPLPTLPTTTPHVVPYTLATTDSSVIWHHRLGHPSPDVLSKLSPSCRVPQLSPALGVEMIHYVMLASLVGTSGCPFLALLLEPFNHLTSYTVTLGPPLF